MISNIFNLFRANGVAAIVALLLALWLHACSSDGEQKSGLIIFLKDDAARDTTITEKKEYLVKANNSKKIKSTKNAVNEVSSEVKLDKDIFEDGYSSEQVAFLQKGHALIQKNRNKEALKVYQQLLVKYPDCYPALCKVGFLYGELGKQTEDEALKKQYIEKSLEYVAEALAIKPDDAEANYIKALAEGYSAEIQPSMRKRAEHLKKMKEHLDKTLAAEPAHNKAWFAMGQWHFAIADMNIVENKLAKLVIGQDAARASYQKAAEAFGNAIKNNPDKLAYHYYLGMALLKANEKNLAKEHLEKATVLKAINPSEEQQQKEAKKMLTGI